jgi:hypothetical protein
MLNVAFAIRAKVAHGSWTLISTVCRVSRFEAVVAHNHLIRQEMEEDDLAPGVVVVRSSDKYSVVTYPSTSYRILHRKNNKEEQAAEAHEAHEAHGFSASTSIIGFRA